MHKKYFDWDFVLLQRYCITAKLCVKLSSGVYKMHNWISLVKDTFYKENILPFLS